MKISPKYLLSITAAIAVLISLTGCKSKDAGIIEFTKWEYKTPEESKFSPLGAEEFTHLEKHVENQKGYLTIKTTFQVPKSLKKENLSLYIGDLQIAGKIFVNGTRIGIFGSFPPKEFYSGKAAKSFSIPKNILLQNKQNELQILMWCNGKCNISNAIYIGEQKNTDMKALENRFIMSDINLLFTVAFLLISLLYFLLYIKWHKEKEYLWYALTNLATTFYLFPYYQSSVPWLTQNGGWLLYNKLFSGIAALLTAYFATSFIREFLSQKDKPIVTTIRLCLLASASVWIDRKSVV